VEGFSSYGRRIGLWLRGVARLAFVAVIAALLLLPWGLHLLGGQLTGALAEGVSQQAPLQEVLAEYQAWNALTVYVPLPLLVAALLGLAWALVRRRWIVTSVVLWVLFLALWVAGRLISFPAANMVQNFAVLIGLYIPASLLVGWLTGALAEWAQRRRRTIWRWLWGLAVLTLALAGTVRQVRVIQPQHIMVTRPDMQAMQWIRQNVATQASFLVEGFRIYEGRTAVGSDAGWWIPLLAGRENTMPPQYALVAERPTDPGYSQQVVQLVANLETAAPASPQGLQYLCAWGISHIYVGQGQGKVGLDARQLFSPETLATASPLDLVYQRDRVYIFALKPQACDQAAP
jgi:hypothetical protein